METKKRLNSEDEPEQKRQALSSDGPLTLDDVEEFQREALFVQLSAYKRERDELKSQLDALNKGDEAVKAELEKLTEKYVDATKKLDRENCPAVQRVYRSAPSGETSSSDSKTSDKTASQSEENAGENNKETKPENSDKERLLAESEELAAGLQNEIAKLKEQLQNSDAEKIKLSQSIATIEQELAAALAAKKIQDARIAEFDGLKQKLAECITNIHTDLDKLKSAQPEIEAKARSQAEKLVQQTEKRLATAEADAKRLRKERDELADEIAIQKTENAAHKNEAKKIQQSLDFELSSKQILEREMTSANTSVDAGNTENLSVDELKQKCESLARQKAALEGEINGLEKGFRKAKEKAREALKSAAESEQKMGVLNTAKVRSDHKYLEAMRAKDAVSSELANTKRALATSAELLSEKRQLEQKLVNQTSQQQKDVVSKDSTIRQRDKDIESLKARLQTADMHIKQSRDAQSGLQKKLFSLEEEKLKVENEKRAAEQQCARVEGQLKSMKAVSGRGTPEEVREQLESLRSIAMCPVCQKNFKNRAVTTCGHAMCDECVQSRLAARMRNCPICNTHFASNDVIPIHL